MAGDEAASIEPSVVVAVGGGGAGSTGDAAVFRDGMLGGLESIGRGKKPLLLLLLFPVEDDDDGAMVAQVLLLILAHALEA